MTAWELGDSILEDGNMISVTHGMSGRGWGWVGWKTGAE